MSDIVQTTFASLNKFQYVLIYCFTASQRWFVLCNAMHLFLKQYFLIIDILDY